MGLFEKLKCYNDDDINEKEVISPSWTRQYSKARAQVFMLKLKQISNIVSEESINKSEMNVNKNINNTKSNDNIDIVKFD
jgi:hypothetical protein